jgi:hypothetical protein
LHIWAEAGRIEGEVEDVGGDRGRKRDGHRIGYLTNRIRRAPEAQARQGVKTTRNRTKVFRQVSESASQRVSESVSQRVWVGQQSDQRAGQRS